MSYALGQMDRILGNLIKIGRIDSVDFDAGTATVDFDGELVTDLEWSKDRAEASARGFPQSSAPPASAMYSLFLDMAKRVISVKK